MLNGLPLLSTMSENFLENVVGEAIRHYRLYSLQIHSTMSELGGRNRLDQRSGITVEQSTQSFDNVGTLVDKFGRRNNQE